MSGNGQAVRPCNASRLIVEDQIRLAVVVCPFCKEEHRYVVPVDILPSAPLERLAKCDARRGLIRILLPTENGLEETS